MRILASGVAMASLIVVMSESSRSDASSSSDPVGQHSAITKPSSADLTDVVQQYCVRCHSERRLTGNLALEGFDIDDSPRWGDTSEKIIAKLRLDMMPPPGAPRPRGDTLRVMAEVLEGLMDDAAARNPTPGNRPFQRLNRPEYKRAIQDLLGLEIDPADFLPPDTRSSGFDNIADAQMPSTTVLESYLNAASEISRLAIGDPSATTREITYPVPRTQSQTVHIEGTPQGTRGGISVMHSFPVDGEYEFDVTFLSGLAGGLYGRAARDEMVEIAIDGTRVAVIPVDRFLHESEPTGRTRGTERISVPAGQRTVSAAFLRSFEGPEEDLIPTHRNSSADLEAAGTFGMTLLPHLRELVVRGPFNATGVSSTPTRARLFTCWPEAAGEEEPCARGILSRLASKAYRRPVTESDLRALMSLYEEGRDREGTFEGGVRMGLQGVLSSAYFLFRVEQPQGALGDGGVYHISDLDLATRLSFFLWGGPPDDRLIELAVAGGLSEPSSLRHEVERMLRDDRSEALATRFGAQWLRLQDLDRTYPDSHYWPNFDNTLRTAMQRETELFLNNIVHEDRSVIQLLTADFSFLNEDLAAHYGVPGVAGNHFRQVEWPLDNPRRGLGILGHGSILAQTSHGNRTSPVLRGLWMMEVLLSSPPPPPPPGVPDLEETDGSADGRSLTVKERMEMHRVNPSCNSCHQYIDPLGLALENFDVSGEWRIKDAGNAIDPSGSLWNGRAIDGPKDLRDALVHFEEPFVRTFTQSLMSYAVGRRIEHFDMPAVRGIARSAAASDYRLSAFVHGVVQSDQFRMNMDLAGATLDGGAK